LGRKRTFDKVSYRPNSATTKAPVPKGPLAESIVFGFDHLACNSAKRRAVATVQAVTVGNRATDQLNDLTYFGIV
jgi:hypothetical protein